MADSHQPDMSTNRIIMRTLGTSSWFRFRSDYVLYGILSKMEAVFLASLMHHKTQVQDKTDTDDFFPCPSDALTSILAWSPKIQKKLLGRLQEKGFVQTKKKGVPPIRWVAFDLLMIEHKLDEAIQANTPASASIKEANHVG